MGDKPNSKWAAARALVAVLAAIAALGAVALPADAVGPTPGAYCSPAGATAQSSKGVSLFCATTSANGTPYNHPRWRVVAGTGTLVPLAINDTPHLVGYNRATDFGGWIDADHDCQNTRNEVLIVESTVTPTYSTAKDCTVTQGRWVDPWSGTVTNVPRDLDIDHMVPLANAWKSGAWTWTQTQRVAYANDLAEPEHLHAILLGENRTKGDQGPEGWKPPSQATWCQYAREWDAIKNRWHLTATTAEWQAMLAMAATC